MLLPLVLIAGYVVGVSRTRTFTTVEKRELLGPKSGTVYKAEIFPAIPLLAVEAPDGSQVHFHGQELAFKAALGDPDTVAAARADFEGSPMFKQLATVGFNL